MKFIGNYRKRYPASEAADLAEAKRSLDTIASAVGDVSDKTAGFLKPFTVLSELIGRIFEFRGIRMTSNIVLGNADRIVRSADLSAGEKQMLSFLCYNAFNSNSPIFIDEPELSLHADWQRTLMPILLSQQTGNQFIVATHSPFIYSKFPEKEFVIGEKGD